MTTIIDFINKLSKEYGHILAHITLSSEIINILALLYLILVIIYNSYYAFKSIKSLSVNLTIIEKINTLSSSSFVIHTALISFSFIILVYRYNVNELFREPFRTQLLLITLFLASIGYIFKSLVISYKNAKLSISNGILTIIRAMLDILPFIFIVTIFIKLK